MRVPRLACGNRLSGFPFQVFASWRHVARTTNRAVHSIVSGFPLLAIAIACVSEASGAYVLLLAGMFLK